MTKKESKKPKKEPKKEPKEKLATDKKEQLPPFPERKGGKTSSSPSGTGEVEEIEEADEIALEEICSDLVAVPFEIWHALKPEIPELTVFEKKHISKPLARVAQKYDVQKYMKDEILLFTFLGFSVFKRARMIKKNDTNDNRKKGKGKNDPSKESNREYTSS